VTEPPCSSCPKTARARGARVTEGGSCLRTARSLRTQQRAWAVPSRLSRSHRQAGCTGEVARSDGLLVSVPPLSTTCESVRLERGSGPTGSGYPPARCSLERR